MRVQAASSSKQAAFKRLEQRQAWQHRFPMATSATLRHSPAFTITSPHPDALRRRQEAEQGAMQRQMDRERSRVLEAAGLKWWQQFSQHMTLMGSVQQFHEHLDKHSDRLVVAACFSEDCYVCRTLHPKLHKIAEEHADDVHFVKINGSCPNFQMMFQELNISSVPWFLFIRNGKIVHGMSASLSPERLQSFRRHLNEFRRA